MKLRRDTKQGKSKKSAWFLEKIDEIDKLIDSQTGKKI